MRKNIYHLAVIVILSSGTLTACTQSTPTMMNTSPVELARETSMEQIALKDITESNLAVLAEQYRQFGGGPLDLTMTYDPKSKSFTAMKAVHELKHIQTALKQKGVANITAQTLPVPDGKPSLLVSFDSVRAQAPSDCGAMPGLNNNETTRAIGDYKFGCGVETMLSKQIARPADLEGNADMGVSPARREAVTIEDYSAGVPRTPLEGINREDIASGS